MTNVSTNERGSVNMHSTMTTTEKSGRKCQRLVLGLGATAYAHALAEQFRGLGWDVLTANTAEAARRLAVTKKATAVVVPVAGEEEGGLLVTAKVINAMPRARIILVVPTRNEQVESFGEFIGAAVVAEADGLAVLVKAIVG